MPTTISGSPAPIELTSTPFQAILPPGLSGTSKRTSAPLRGRLVRSFERVPARGDPLLMLEADGTVMVWSDRNGYKIKPLNSVV